MSPRFTFNCTFMTDFYGNSLSLTGPVLFSSSLPETVGRVIFYDFGLTKSKSWPLKSKEFGDLLFDKFEFEVRQRIIENFVMLCNVFYLHNLFEEATCTFQTKVRTKLDPYYHIRRETKLIVINFEFWYNTDVHWHLFCI